jgi:uncharacterized protein (DUF1800 family)
VFVALAAIQNGASLSAGAADMPTDRAAVAHALNRLTFGPRPGQVDDVQKLGLSRWLDQQLNPSAIDDAALAARLAPLPARPDELGRVAGRNLSEQERMEAQRRARQFSRQSVQALAAQKLTRAVYSERQLEEVLVDFWFNHFNVFAGKGRTATYIPEYEQEAIRPHIWGSFRDLLGATAKSPAMLFYLDNWLSADPKAAEQMQQQQQLQRARRRGRLGGAGNDMPPPNQQAPRRNGLNENYARELMELHTLGVDGGYTQQDIVEVARALTGWTLANGIDGGFRFTPALHDRGEKKVLGHTIRSGGIEDGERVLDIVAAHPSTAQHIATKLVRRFVNDEPPAALVDKVAATFTKTKGNLREVVRTLVTAPEFYAAEHRNAKVKTPLEFVVSGVRATGRELRDARPMLNALQQLGMAPYMCQPPTGYDDTAETWISAGALVTRMNIAQQLAPQRAAEIGGPEFQRR